MNIRDKVIKRLASVKSIVTLTLTAVLLIWPLPAISRRIL